MATKLAKQVKREVDINGQPHTVVMDADGILVLPKRSRVGNVLTWEQVAGLCNGRTHTVVAVQKPATK